MHLLGQIWIYREFVETIRCSEDATLSQTQQIVFPHHFQNTVASYHITTTPQLFIVDYQVSVVSFDKNNNLLVYHRILDLDVDAEITTYYGNLTYNSYFNFSY